MSLRSIPSIINKFLSHVERSVASFVVIPVAAHFSQLRRHNHVHDWNNHPFPPLQPELLSISSQNSHRLNQLMENQLSQESESSISSIFVESHKRLQNALQDIELLQQHIWFAVPKRKTSYSRKRLRQMNPQYQLDDNQSFYPCPKCDHGYLKLRHHICPCDQESLKCKAVVKINYDGTKKVPRD
jgi:ribosomal protein L32